MVITIVGVVLGALGKVGGEYAEAAAANRTWEDLFNAPVTKAGETGESEEQRVGEDGGSHGDQSRSGDEDENAKDEWPEDTANEMDRAGSG